MYGGTKSRTNRSGLRLEKAVGEEIVRGVVGRGGESKILKEREGRLVTSGQLEIEHHRSRTGREEGPQPGLSSRSRPGWIKNADGRFIANHITTGNNHRTQKAVHGTQQVRRMFNPLAHRLAAEGGAQPLKHGFLPVQGNRISVLGKHHVRHQSWTDLSTGDDTCWQFGDPRCTNLFRAGVDGPDQLASKQLAGLVVDLLGDLLADLTQRLSIRSDLLFLGKIHDDLFQDRQFLHATDTAHGAFTGRLGLRRGLGRCNDLDVTLDRLPGQLELIGIELFRGAPEVASEQLLQLCLRCIAFHPGDPQFLPARCV